MSTDKTFPTCWERGLVGAPEHVEKPVAYGRGLADAAPVSEGNLILLYKKTGRREGEVHGFYRATQDLYRDTTPIWQHEKVFEWRVGIEGTKDVTFGQPILVSDLFELADQGALWIWRSGVGDRDVIPLAESEVREIHRLFLAGNPSGPTAYKPMNPYRPDRISPLPISLETDGKGRLEGLGGGEAHITAHLMHGFARGLYMNLFGHYTDYLNYVPTSYGKEIDILLLYESKLAETPYLTHATVIEVKRDTAEEGDLGQLLRYEEWLIRRRFKGEVRMVDSVLIAHDFDNELVNYVNKRNSIEGRKVSLFRYRLDKSKGSMFLEPDESQKTIGLESQTSLDTAGFSHCR